MAQSLFTFGVALASVSFVSAYGEAQAQCNSYGVDFQEGGEYFQNNASSDPFTAFQYFSGCSNDTANNILVDPQGNQAQCSNTNMQPNKQTQLITCSNNPKDQLYSGNWSIIIISNNGNMDPIAYQRDFSLDVGEQSTTTVYPTVTQTPDSTTVETSTKNQQTTVTSTVPKTTVTKTHKQSHGWTLHPLPTYVKTTKTLHTYTATFTEWRVSASLEMAAAECTAPTAPGYQDKKANILPTVLGELDQVAKKVIGGVDDVVEGVVGGLLGGVANHGHGHGHGHGKAHAYKRAIIEGRQPTEEEKRGFVEERNARMAARSAIIEKRHPDNRTVTTTATQLATTTLPIIGGLTTLTDVITNMETVTTTISKGTATVYAEQSAPLTTKAPVPTFTWTVYQPFALETTTVWKTFAITNTITTTAYGAQASCAMKNSYMH